MGAGSYTSFESAWGEGLPPAQAPQKVFAGGNLPQKVIEGGNRPEKVFANSRPMNNGNNGYSMPERMLQQIVAQQQRQASEIARLMQLVSVSKRPTGMSIGDVTLIVLALVFIVLVLFLINAVSRLTK